MDKVKRYLVFKEQLLDESDPCVLIDATDERVVRVRLESDYDCLSAHVATLAGALRDLVEQVESLEGVEYTRDIDRYKAEANFEHAVERANKALASLAGQGVDK